MNRSSCSLFSCTAAVIVVASDNMHGGDGIRRRYGHRVIILYGRVVTFFLSLRVLDTTAVADGTLVVCRYYVVTNVRCASLPILLVDVFPVELPTILKVDLR